MSGRPVGGTVALVTCAARPGITEDDTLLEQALRSRGVAAAGVPWDSPSADWGGYRAVVLRSTWDYHLHHARFSGWLAALESVGVPVLNPVDTIRWNADKGYLLQLEALGAAIVPTLVCDWAGLGEASMAHGDGAVVIKPTVSANSWHVTQGIPGTAALAEDIDALPRGLAYLVQPYLPEIEAEGEWSLVFIDGRYSHAVRKRPARHDYRVQPDFGGTAVPEVPPTLVHDGAIQCLRAVGHAGHDGMAYARVDGVVRSGCFCLMEVELIEPNLFLHAHPAAPDRLAAAILRRA